MACHSTAIAVVFLPTAMAYPKITLQPQGSHPPSALQKLNILSILGASPLGHQHQQSDVTGLIEALQELAAADADRVVLIPSATAPTTVGQEPNTWWFDTTDGTVSVLVESAWVQLAGGGGGGGDPAPRQTFDVAPVTDDVLELPPATDASIYLRPAASIPRLDVLFPINPADGQIVSINTAPGVARTVTLRLYFAGIPGGAYTSELMNEGDARSYQYFLTTATWRSL